MAGMSSYEKVVLGLTAAFVLFTGGWFLSERNTAAPYEVTTIQSGRDDAPDRPDPEDENERPDSLLEGETIDLNTADAYDLQRLPGIGEKRARDIVAYREEHGPFQTVDDLVQVKGIGPATLEGLKQYATVT